MTEILVFDTETTGIPDWQTPSGGDNQPHIVQLAGLLVDTDTKEVKQSMDVIIRPDGWEIPQECIDVHGITNEYAHDVGVPEELAVEMFLAMWNGNLQVAHNTTFDRRIIRIGTKRFFSEDIQDAWKECEYECTMLKAKPIMKMEPKGKYGYKPPKLEEAYSYFLGEEMENAHNALADATACMKIYFEMQGWDE